MVSAKNQIEFIKNFSFLNIFKCDNPNQECQKQFRNGEDVLSFFNVDPVNYFSSLF